MRPVIAIVGPLSAASANNIALSQTPGAAGPLTLNGSAVTNGVATLDHPRRVLITTTDNTHTVTVMGTNASGLSQSEVVTGNGTSGATLLDYATVSSVVISGAATAAVTVGTNGIAATAWVRLDDWAPGGCSIECDVTGTVSYSVQSSSDDPNSPTNPVAPNAMVWTASSDTNAATATGSILTSYPTGTGAPYMPLWVRVLLNSGTGTVTATVTQFGVNPR